MKREAHEAECRIKLGDSFTDVHLWLDELAGSPEYGMRHRRVRHHLAGIREAEKLFGKAGAQAARLHIISDLKEEGWTEADPFPKDQRDYVKMGFF